MAGENIVPFAVFATREQGEIIDKLAASEYRSVSHMLIGLALERAQQKGIGRDPPKPRTSKSRKAAEKPPLAPPPTPVAEAGGDRPHPRTLAARKFRRDR